MELACIGHWYTDLLYLAPVLVMGALIGRDKFKHRRSAARSPAAGYQSGTNLSETQVN